MSSQQKTPSPMSEKSCMALLQQPKASQSPAASLLPVLPIGVVPSAGRKASGAVGRAAKSVVAVIQGGVGHTRTREAQVPILSRALSNTSILVFSVMHCHQRSKGRCLWPNHSGRLWLQ